MKCFMDICAQFGSCPLLRILAWKSTFAGMCPNSGKKSLLLFKRLVIMESLITKEPRIEPPIQAP